jgi:hypothetical protein
VRSTPRSGRDHRGKLAARDGHQRVDAGPGEVARADGVGEPLQARSRTARYGPTADHGRTILPRNRHGIRRNAEDMRAFVLKREVLRSGLVTEEESRAYRDTLNLPAGQPALVRPWSQDDE